MDFRWIYYVPLLRNNIIVIRDMILKSHGSGLIQLCLGGLFDLSFKQNGRFKSFLIRKRKDCKRCCLFYAIIDGYSPTFNTCKDILLPGVIYC